MAEPEPMLVPAAAAPVGEKRCCPGDEETDPSSKRPRVQTDQKNGSAKGEEEEPEEEDGGDGAGHGTIMAVIVYRD